MSWAHNQHQKVLIFLEFLTSVHTLRCCLKRSVREDDDPVETGENVKRARQRIEGDQQREEAPIRRRCTHGLVLT